MPETKITILDEEITPLEYKGQRVLTLAMIDKVHKRSEGTAYQRFNDNREYFVEGEDFYIVDYSERYVFRTFGIEVPPQ